MAQSLNTHETLEEVAEKLFPDSNIQKRIFIKGGKFQKERLLKFVNDEDNHTEGELGNSCIDVQTLIYFINLI